MMDKDMGRIAPKVGSYRNSFQAILLTLFILLLPRPTCAMEEIAADKLGMILPDSGGEYQNYDIFEQLNKIQSIKSSRGLIVGRGSHQGMGLLSTQFSDIQWTYLDPYAIAHDINKNDPFLILDFSVKSREAFNVFQELAQTFDFVVIDLKTIQFFPKKEDVVYRGLYLLKPTGKLIFPLEDELDLAFLEKLPIYDGLSIAEDYSQWPFPGENFPSNYLLDMTRRSGNTHYATISFNQNMNFSELADSISRSFLRNDNYYTKFFNFLFTIDQGTGFGYSGNSEDYENVLDLISKLYFAHNQEDIEQLSHNLEHIALNPESDPKLSGFIYWVLGEKHLRINKEIALQYFKEGKLRKSILSAYRLDPSDDIQQSLENLFNILRANDFKKYIYGLLMTDDNSVVKELHNTLSKIAPLHKTIPALSFQVLAIISKALNRATTIITQQINKFQEARKELFKKY